MLRKIGLAALLAAVTTIVSAAQPNMQPGRWEYTNTTSFSGPVNIPDQQNTHTQCVTAEDIEEADTFLRNAEQCSIEDRDIGSDAVSYTMVCPGQQGGEMRMEVDMQVMGDRVSGRSTATLTMNGQSMDMVTRIKGQRVGDC